MSDFPYPGLRPFQRNETDIFFGREQHTDQLIEKLQSNHFLTVVGPSGCGKSSLVKTGLLAGLESGFLAGASTNWRVAEFRPGDKPLLRLATALLKEKALELEYAADFKKISEAIAFLHASLCWGPLSLHEVLADTPLPENTNLLILVDQFEEIFRLATLTDKAAAFVALLIASSQHPNIYIVITMRSDFIGDCAMFQGLPEMINQGLFLTPRLNREQLKEAIEGPASMFDGQIDSTLVNRLLNDVGSNSDQLPLLQHVLMRMWNLATHKKNVGLTIEHYNQIGQLEQALSKHAEEAYAELSDHQQKIAEILFCNLTESEDGKYIRRPIKLGEIATQADIPWKQVATVADVFRKADRNFIVPPLGQDLDEDSLLDISHESLIRQWQRLEEWTRREVEFVTIYQRLEDTAKLWDKGQAALWGSPDLEIAIKWRSNKNMGWVNRYSKAPEDNFNLALKFLDASETAQREKLEAKEKIRQQELYEARKRTTWAVIAFCVALILATFASVESYLAITHKQKAVEAKLSSQLNNATWLARFKDYSTAKTVLKEVNNSEIPTARQHSFKLLDWFVHLMGGEAEDIFALPGEPLYTIDVSADGKFLVTGGEKNNLFVYTTDNSSKPLHVLAGHSESVWTVKFHNQSIISSGDDKRIIFWDTLSGRKLRELKSLINVRALAISPDGKYLASGGGNKDESIESNDNLDNLSIWELATGKKMFGLPGHTDDIADGGLAFSPDGKYLASASLDKTARIWEVKTGRLLHILSGHTSTVEKAVFSPNSSLLATCSSDKTVRLWEIGTEQVNVLYRLQGHQEEVYGLKFIAEGRHLISASEDKTLRIWDTRSGVLLRVLQDHAGAINDIATYKDTIYSASLDNTVRSWDAKLPNQQIVDNLPDVPTSVSIAPRGGLLAVGFKTGLLQLYSTEKLTLLQEIEDAHTDWVVRLSFNSNGSELISGSFDGRAKLWQVKDNKLLKSQVFEVDAAVYSVTFSPDDKLIATSDDKGRVGIFNIGTDQKNFLDAHNGIAYSVSFNHDGSKLLTSGSDNYLKLWQFNQQKPIWSIDKRYEILSATFSADDKQISHVGLDNLVHIYEVDKAKEQYAIGHTEMLTRAIFSLDNKQVITASTDSTIRVWDLSETVISHLFTLQPTNEPLWDFDFRCEDKSCKIAVPLLGERKLVLYDLGVIY
ncbi:hypothetical protein QUF74_01885 [Candidatus Halobeggiatoa sp. HSG11]|nr:hypothetical protein [Candidatus Halobeggiatoa sp. HSG11]